MEGALRIAGVVKESIVDGPGIRYVVFTQGCPHKCEGCHNPDTHDFQSGNLVSIDKIAQDINKNPLLKGVTISGGEPFMQAKEVSNLLSKINRDKLDVMVYTGFVYENILNNANEQNGFNTLLQNADILIDGKFKLDLKSSDLQFRGSQNQRAIDIKESIGKGEVTLYNF